MARRINAAGLSLVQSFEGLRLQAYRDAVGVWTIGYGHTAGVKAGQTITEAQATKFLLADLADAENAVERFVTVPLNDNQFAALVSFTFNCGVEAFRRSTLRKKLNARDYDAVPGQLARWVKGAGKTLPGLVRRRKAEADLWNTPFIATKPAPSLKDAQQTAGVPVNQKAPESAPTASSGGKAVAAGAAGILVFAAAFWATVEGWWAHLITLIERIF